MGSTYPNLLHSIVLFENVTSFVEFWKFKVCW